MRKRNRNRAAALILAAVTACGLIGCGGQGADSSANNTSKGASGGQNQKENSQAAAGGSQGADDAAGSASADIGALSLTLTTTYSETEMAGQVISHFIDYLNKNSNGAVKVDVYWGGTLVGNGEELAFVGSAGADMSVIGQSTYTDVLSLMNFPSKVAGGYQAAIDYMDDIVFKNGTTAPLIQAQIEAQNVKMLGSVATGSNTFVSKKEASGLSDLTGMKLGVGMEQSAFEALGFNGVVTVMPWDYYDSLSRGIAEVGYMSASALVSMSVQEVTPYFLMDGTYVAGNFMTINLDKWNGMSQAQQELFQAAMDDTAAFSVTLAQQLDEESQLNIEGAGGRVTTLSEEETKAVQEAFFNTGVTDCRSFAETAGCQDDMETVLKAVSEYLGIELK